jgi:DNA repair protein SbcD/Mre11
MKILHTADWHLGHRLHEQSQFEEQSQFLEWLINYINDCDIDMLLISGDIFDTGVPSTQSQKLYYDFLIQLTKTNCSHVVITGGNHDAPGTINAPKSLLSSLGIKVVGKVTPELKDEVFKLKVKDEEIIIAAVPYLRDQDIRKASAGETFTEIGDRYKIALVNHYQEVAQYSKSINNTVVPVIAMGHLFAIGGSTSDSEQTIYVGNLGDIGAEDFPESFNYIALGHLHRPQKIGGYEYIRYSGSPNILSFSEINYQKKIVVLETANKEIKTINEVDVPHFRKVLRVTGTVAECIEELGAIVVAENDLTPWVEVVIDNDVNNTISHIEINEVAEELPIEVLKITLKNQRILKGIEELIEETKHIKELTPVEIFKLKCKEMDIDLNENKVMFDAFNEVVQIAREN